MADKLLNFDKAELLGELWAQSPEARALLRRSRSLNDARNRFFRYLNDLERHYFNIYSTEKFKDVHISDKHIAKECIRVLKNVIRSENDKLAGFSALTALRELAKDECGEALQETGEGFLIEFIHLFRGINGKSGLLTKTSSLLRIKESESRAGHIRSRELDVYSSRLTKAFRRYRCGLDPDLTADRMGNVRRIMSFFKARESDWCNPTWQIRNVLRDAAMISELVHLENDEREGLFAAEKLGIPVQITPYYLSLFNHEGRSDFDRAIRAQVIPTAYYCRTVAARRKEGASMDYMGERSTSPVECVTRRYPQIVILKPFNSCPQICVYCQRNWEITDLCHGRITGEAMQKALSWIEGNSNITEVLITGGDPLTLPDRDLLPIVYRLARMDHVRRIRIGTRTLVTLPFRFDPHLLKALSAYHEWGRREICLVTHFETSGEITPEVLDAVNRIKSAGMNIYNQQVFTYYNSRRYETCFLRRNLKLCGIDPYYTFNTKGKEETADFRVPIARIEQEKKEEARLLPGMERLDEPVFNVPRLGKSHLVAWQDHEPIMILPDGKRIYRFYPWEERLRIADDYLYTDVSIYGYLRRLDEDGEDIGGYESIWYYF